MNTSVKMARTVAAIAAGLAALIAVLLIGARFVPVLGLLTLPASWPGLFILGADETQERFGYWGELILVWLCSLPCIVLYAWLLNRCRERSRWPDGKIDVH